MKKYKIKQMMLIITKITSLLQKEENLLIEKISKKILITKIKINSLRHRCQNNLKTKKFELFLLINLFFLLKFVKNYNKFYIGVSITSNFIKCKIIIFIYI